jgi:hypothetical protein
VAGLLTHARARLEAARVLLNARAPGDAASRAYYDYDPTGSLDAAEAERDVRDAQGIVDAVAEHLSR